MFFEVFCSPNHIFYLRHIPNNRLSKQYNNAAASTCYNLKAAVGREPFKGVRGLQYQYN
jgi:hypothetical protein